MFFFQGRRVSVTEIIDAFRPLVPRIRKDMAPLRGVIPMYKQPRPRFRWATAPSFLGSYACYKPGQYTTIAGAEGEAVDGLHFAGEHTSLAFQGFMNGAVESGERAAREILASLRK